MENGSSSSTGPRRQSRACSYSGVPKIERKVIEKNRRNQMKALFSKLSSLLPPHYISKGRDGQQLPEQVEEAANYIKSLQTKFEKLKDEKDKLFLSNKRPYGAAMVNENQAIAAKKPSQIEINEMGPDLDIILITELDNHSMFYDILRLLDEQAGEVVHANFSVPGPSNFHLVHKKIAACEISKRLKELVDGSSSSSNQELVDGLSYNEDYSDLQLWDFEIQSNDIWDFAVPAVMPMENLGRCYM